MKPSLESIQDIMETIVEPGIGTAPHGPLPRNAWVTRDHYCARRWLEPKSKTYLREIEQFAPKSGAVPDLIPGPTSKVKSDDAYHYKRAGEIVDLFARDLDREFMPGSQYVRFFTKEVSRPARLGIADPMVADCVATAAFDLEILCCAVWSGYNDPHGIVPVLRRILQSGGLRVGWRGTFPKKGEPVVYWPFAEDPEYADL